MNEILPVVRKKKPSLKIILMLAGAVVVLSVLAYLVFSFKSNITGLFRKDPSVSLDQKDAMNSISKPKNSPFSPAEAEVPLAIPDSQKNCEYYSCIDLKKGQPTLEEISDCVSRYSELNVPKASYIEDDGGAIGVIESLSPTELSITFLGGKTLSVSSVSTITIGGYSFNDTLFKGSRLLEYDIGEILSVIKPGNLVVLVYGGNDVFNSLDLRCYVE
jgi:hypothetical protein